MNKLAVSILTKHPGVVADEQNNIVCTGCKKNVHREGPEWANAGPLQFYVTHCVDEAIKENRKLNGDVNGI